MKRITLILVMALLHSATAWAEPTCNEPKTVPSATAAQPGDLSRFEIRATSLLFYGTAIGLAGIEMGLVSPTGYTAEIQLFSLIALAGSGWQATARVGRRFDDTSDLVLHENRFYSGFTPLVGIRYGEFPWTGSSDGYDYRSTDLGLQAGMAFDWGYGALNGFASRIEALVTYNVLSKPNYGGDWSYAGGMNPTITFDIGVLFGAYFAVE